MAKIFSVQLCLVLGLVLGTVQSLASNKCQKNHLLCGNICYSPRVNKGCCNNEVFDTQQKICCGENLVNIDGGGGLGCCSGRTFNTEIEICCDGINFSRLHWIPSKGGKLNRLGSYEKCCGDKPHDDETHKCCEGYGADGMVWDQREKNESRKYECCEYMNGSIKVIDSDAETCREFKLCGRQMYYLDQHICCQGRLLNYPEGLGSRNASCCNGSPYNVIQQSCCFDTYLTRFKEPNETCCASSPTGKIDGSTQLCCANGPLPKTSASQKCCHANVIDSDHQGCCHNSTTNTHQSFNLTTHVCCGGSVVSKATECCGNRWILKDNEVCCPRGGPINVTDSQQRCCENEYGRQVFNPRTQTCTEGIVKSFSCGGPGKICCQGVERDAQGGEVECCEPGIFSYFRSNQTCCDGSVHNGSNLPCCGRGPCPHTDSCPASYNTSCGQDCLTNGQFLCCGGQVYPYGVGPNRRSCCGRSTYNASTQRCVNGTVKGLKMCPGLRCGGKLKKGGLVCGSTNNSVLVFQGVAKKRKDGSSVMFRNIARLTKCGASPPQKTVFPKKIKHETPKKCQCNLMNGEMYLIVVINYQQHQLRKQIYSLGTQDLVLRYTLENYVRIKQKNPLPSKNRRKYE